MKDFDITITDATKEFLAKKGKHTITIDVVMSGAACCVNMETADIRLHPPRDPEKFNLYTVDGIDIYLLKSAIVQKPVLTLDIEGALFLKSIVPKGLYLQTPIN